jgi:hypothetical protein
MLKFSVKVGIVLPDNITHSCLVDVALIVPTILKPKSVPFWEFSVKRRYRVIRAHGPKSLKLLASRPPSSGMAISRQLASHRR